jgi:Transposase DDE domain
MELEIIEMYCAADDLLKDMKVRDDIQVKMTTAEVITVSLVSARYFGGNLEKSREFLKEHGYIPNMLSKSRLCQRLQEVPEEFWLRLPLSLNSVKKEIEQAKEFIVDSFPIPCCKNIRIKNCKLYRGEEHRGYNVAKREYFFGLKGHVILTAKNLLPVEMILGPGRENDGKAFKKFYLNLPEGSNIYRDSAYTDYADEDVAQEAENIHLLTQRKKNSKRPHRGCMNYIIECCRKKIESGFSRICALLPRSIHAVTRRGFELKALYFVMASLFMATS